MRRIEIPESYQKHIESRRDITIDDNTWRDLPYRPKSDCPVCKGAGFIHPRDGDRVLYDRVVYCTEKGCLFDSMRGNQPPEEQRQCFETFMPVAGAQEALKYSKRLAHGEAKFVWLLLYGNTGNGKTHLCNSIVKVVRERGAEVRMILAADFFARLREAMQTNRTDAVMRSFKDTFFLAIDDYGVEYGSDWESAKFDELMTSRFATSKPTLLITNKDLSELPDRILSRFTDNRLARIAHNSAPDFRGKK